MWIHNVLVLSHIFGIPSLVCAYKSNLLDFIVILIILTNSILMHISETKHRLVPMNKFLKNWSNVFLNFDRCSALFGSLYFLYFLIWPKLNLNMIMLIIIAFINLIIGENTQNNMLYVITHIIWHMIVFLFYYIFS
jgi:hypothetical protein